MGKRIRQMTAEEREGLEITATYHREDDAHASMFGVIAMMVGAGFFGGYATFIAAMALCQSFVSAWWCAIPGGVISALWAGLLIRRRQQAEDARWTETVESTRRAQAHQVEAVDYQITDAVMAGTPGSGDWVFCFLQVGPKTILAIGDDDFAKPYRQGSFPNRQMTVSHLPLSQRAVTVEATGTPFPPSRTRRALNGEVEYVPYSGEILTGSLKNLDARLRDLKKRTGQTWTATCNEDE